jgi:putative ABC transport system permease protein
MEQIVATSIGYQRFAMLLLGIFAAVAMILSAVGIYGVISYSVAQRTQEIGIRMSLGASTRDVLKLVVVQVMLLAGIGVALCIGAALVGARLMSTLLFGVSAYDPLVFAGVALLLSSVALTASYLPARRATRVDPLIALRYE